VDLVGTFTLFATILTIAAFIGAGLGYVFAHDKDDPHRAGKRTTIVLGTLLALLVILFAQYRQAPESSVITLLPGVPFPGSTLTACHIGSADLPQGVPSAVRPSAPDSRIQGGSLLIRGGSALSSPMTTAAQSFDTVEGTQTTVKASNSSQGIEDVHNGDADIGLSGSFKEADPQATTSHYYVDVDDFQLAVVPFTVVVSADLAGRVQNLTHQQLIGVYSGVITDWRSIGGPAEPITVVNRAPGSATRDAFERYVLSSKTRSGVGVDEDTTDQVLTLVKETRGAIGYAATTSLIKPSYRTSVAPVCIDGVGATKAAIVAGTYPFWSFEHAYALHTLPEGKQAIVQDFLRYVCDDKVKDALLVGNGFLRIKDLSDATRKARSAAEKSTIAECSPTTVG
jgi:phosphate transport system substrate-binding protein